MEVVSLYNNYCTCLVFEIFKKKQCGTYITVIYPLKGYSHFSSGMSVLTFFCEVYDIIIKIQTLLVLQSLIYL